MHAHGMRVARTREGIVSAVPYLLCLLCACGVPVRLSCNKIPVCSQSNVNCALNFYRVGGPLKVYLSHRCETFGPIFSLRYHAIQAVKLRCEGRSLTLSNASRLTRPERSRLLLVSEMTLLVTWALFPVGPAEL